MRDLRNCAISSLRSPYSHTPTTDFQNLSSAACLCNKLRLLKAGGCTGIGKLIVRGRKKMVNILVESKYVKIYVDLQR